MIRLWQIVPPRSDCDDRWHLTLHYPSALLYWIWLHAGSNYTLQILGIDDEQYSEQTFQQSKTGNEHPVDSRDKYNFVYQQVSVFVAADIGV